MTPDVHIIYLRRCWFSANTNVDLNNSNNEGATSKNWDGDTLRQTWRKNIHFFWLLSSTYSNPDRKVDWLELVEWDMTWYDVSIFFDFSWRYCILLDKSSNTWPTWEVAASLVVILETLRRFLAQFVQEWGNHQNPRGLKTYHIYISYTYHIHIHNIYYVHEKLPFELDSPEDFHSQAAKSRSRRTNPAARYASFSHGPKSPTVEWHWLNDL